jgi:GntR family transcriptional regulator
MAKSSVASSAKASRLENRIIPLYHQFEQVIRYRIATRQYDFGLRIPSEQELACELDVSLATIREALRELFREHLLVKARGRGTFVAAEVPQMLRPIKYNGVLEDLYERVEQIKVATVTISRRSSPTPCARFSTSRRL